MGPHRLDDQRSRRSTLGCSEGSARFDRLNRSIYGVRQHRLLIRDNDQGSAPIESLFALVLLLFLVLGTIEIAFALYGRNVLASSAHEAARAAVELGRDPDEAAAIATNTVVRSAGGLTRELNVRVQTDQSVVRVTVTGVVDAFGPVPFPFPVKAVATAHAGERPR